jgi:hypothetical protein
VVSGPRGHTGPLRVVFVAELSDGLDPGQYRRSDAYTLKGRGLSHSRTAVVAEELLDACAGLRDHGRLEMTLVLRLHPKQGRDDLGPLCDEFDEVSAGGDPLEVVATADLVVGMSSMLLIQADDIGVPCLSVLPREAERAWLPEVASGSIPSVTTRASLSAEIRRLLAASQVGRAQAGGHHAVEYGLDAAPSVHIAGHVHLADGAVLLSPSRVVGTLDQVLATGTVGDGRLVLVHHNQDAVPSHGAPQGLDW